MKTLYDIMDDNPNRIDEFAAQCDAFTNSQYIQAADRIADILMTVAKSRLLYQLFADILKDFDYKATVKECRQEHPSGVSVIVLPEDERKTAAFMFCLLFDIDSQNINLRDFLLSFFQMGDNNLFNAYSNFINYAVPRFKNAVLEIYAAHYPKETPKPAKKAKPAPRPEPEPTPEVKEPETEEIYDEPEVAPVEKKEPVIENPTDILKAFVTEVSELKIKHGKKKALLEQSSYYHKVMKGGSEDEKAFAYLKLYQMTAESAPDLLHHVRKLENF